MDEKNNNDNINEQNLFTTLGKLIESKVDNEEISRAHKQGSHLLSLLESEKTKLDPENELKTAVMFIVEGLNSGLHPLDLSKKELQILQEFYGENWYKKFGYKRSEVPHVSISLEKLERLKN